MPTKASQKCASCGGMEGYQNFGQCSVCKRVFYCSKDCQESHWLEHKEACKPPTNIEKPFEHIQLCKTMKCKKKNTLSKKDFTLADLVGKKCLVSCYLQRKKTHAL
ncbi:hypothetical protein AMECASPLE_006639 [Ameca splendens]|uniref:MYND-type domain-containing protein n=1 Tax=Ameca splendens TaxID=208324 RepID=A0ABV0ZVC8_9TELE